MNANEFDNQKFGVMEFGNGYTVVQHHRTEDGERYYTMHSSPMSQIDADATAKRFMTTPYRLYAVAPDSACLADLGCFSRRELAAVHANDTAENNCLLANEIGIAKFVIVDERNQGRWYYHVDITEADGWYADLYQDPGYRLSGGAI